jgi:hypothetical protein
MEERYPARYLSKVAPQFVPNEVLQQVTNVLIRGSSDDESALKAFGQASEILYSAAERWRAIRDSSWILRLSLPSGQETIVTQEFLAFGEARKTFLETPSLPTAQIACIDSRLATATLLSFWQEFTRPEHNTQVLAFLDGLKDLKRQMMEFSKQVSLEDNQRLQRYTQSVQRRIDMVTALLNGRPTQAEEILLAAK